MRNFTFFLVLSYLLYFPNSQQMYLNNQTTTTFIIKDGVTNQAFINTQNAFGCTMPKFFIYEDYLHNEYQIVTTNVTLNSISGKYSQIQCNIKCTGDNCIGIINNKCPNQGKNSINWITITANNKIYEYLVNCFPQSVYKPFEWGLFILLIICTIIITLSSLFSKAWSYGGIGINVTFTFIIVFNVLVVLGTFAAYFIPEIIVVLLNIFGSLIGTFGVMVCLNQTLWLFKKRFLSKQVIWRIRIIDFISLSLSAILMVLFWVFQGNWILNNVFAVCTIIASIKIFKIRAFKQGVTLLISLLLIQISVGLFVHYILKVSYNNLMINQFQSPIVVVLPSITPELYRRCAWLPITALIFPGLMLSYLRRFDLSRSTFLYLLIGYVSFYIGSMLWMLIDTLTVHSLPFAIISQPITIIIVISVSYRRNELTTLWGGFFYDNQLPQMSQQLLPSQKEGNSDVQIKRITQMTANLKIQNLSSSDDMHQVYIDYKMKDQL